MSGVATGGTGRDESRSRSLSTSRLFFRPILLRQGMPYPVSMKLPNLCHEPLLVPVLVLGVPLVLVHPVDAPILAPARSRVF